MTKEDIANNTQNIIASIDNSIEKNDFQVIIQQLTFLSHCNINLLNKYIESFPAEQKITDEKFLLEIALFQSEQKLNEQKIDEAEKLIDAVLEKSIHIQYKKTEVPALLQKAVLNLYLQKKDDAIAILNNCETLALADNNHELLIEVYIYAYHFYSETDTQKAAGYIYKALEISKAANNVYKQAYALMHIGTLNTILNNNDAALEFYNESLALLKTLKLNISIADNMMCQFNIYYRKKAFHKAVECLEYAIQLATDCGWNHKIAICYGNLSTTFIQLSNFEAAKQYAEKDIELSAQLNNIYNVGIAKFRLGKIEAALGNLQTAIRLINESVEIRKNKITNTQLIQAYQDLYPVYARAEDYKNAFEAQSNYMKLKFEFLDAEKTKENEVLRAKYEAEKREAELKEARLQHTESELKALKAQMNPHFIFNALNSIQEIFFLGDKRLANKHLSQFSQLTRKILHASGKAYISLHEEIEMLQQYLSLEALRFGNDFNYIIETAEAIDIYSLELPPLLIQPYVENAVKHGLMHKATNRKLQLYFSINEAENILLATIEDNGIGRTAAEKINQNKQRMGQSFASEATAKRLSLINHNTPEKTAVVYTDLTDENNNALGTRVEIAIPVKY